jgi:hypothetical protein
MAVNEERIKSVHIPSLHQYNPLTYTGRRLIYRFDADNNKLGFRTEGRALLNGIVRSNYCQYVGTSGWLVSRSEHGTTENCFRGRSGSLSSKQSQAKDFDVSVNSTSIWNWTHSTLPLACVSISISSYLMDSLLIFWIVRNRSVIDKTHLLFVIRDHVGSTPLSNLENTITTDLNRIWDTLVKVDCVNMIDPLI